MTLVSLRKHPFLLALRRWDVSRGGTSVTQRQKFHTDDANECLRINESGSHGVPNINLSSFTCLLVDFGKVLCSSANELQQNFNTSSKEDFISQRFFAFLFDLCGLLSVVRKQYLKQCNYSIAQPVLLTGFRTDFTSSAWNFCRWVADVPPREKSPAAKSEEKRQ